MGQSDTIFSNNDKIICSIKEITPDVVKFTYPNEDLMNSIYKNTIQKIVFRSGRIQTFAESTSFKTVKEPQDYENVAITKVEGEVKGLYKIGDVSSKAKGTTEFSNQERVKERAYRKLKIQAAMMGANIIFLTDARTQGNKFGSKYESSQSSEASFSGIAYTNVIPDFEEFRKTISDKGVFVIVEKRQLWSGASDISIKNSNKPFKINRIYSETGFTYLDASIEDIDQNIFRVVNFSEHSCSIFYRDKSSVYNLKVLF